MTSRMLYLLLEDMRSGELWVREFEIKSVHPSGYITTIENGMRVYILGVI